MLDSINQEQELYVIKCGSGYTCLGFDVALQKAIAVARWAETDAPDPSLIGTEAGYADYERCMAAGFSGFQRTGQRCRAELTEQLVGLRHRRVEVVDRYGDKRRFYVGMSTGWFPVHLEIKTSRSTGGGAVYGAPFQSVRVIR